MKSKPKRAASRPVAGKGEPPQGKFRELRKYMLDTDICIHLIEGHPAATERFVKLQAGEVVISAVALAELRYGALAIHEKKARNFGLGGLEKFADIVPVLSFDEDAALTYAHVRMADPKRNIRAMDKLIAAHAIALNLILVTNNVKDFQKFRPALRVENWTAKKR